MYCVNTFEFQCVAQIYRELNSSSDVCQELLPHGNDATGEPCGWREAESHRPTATNQNFQSRTLPENENDGNLEI